MTSKLSITVSLTIAPNTAQISISGPLTVENVPTVIAVARRVSCFDGGFDICIDMSGLGRAEPGALQALQASGFRLSAVAGAQPHRPAIAVPA